MQSLEITIDKYDLDLEARFSYREVGEDTIYFDELECFINNKNIGDVVSDLNCWEDVCSSICEDIGFKNWESN